MYANFLNKKEKLINLERKRQLVVSLSQTISTNNVLLMANSYQI